jgi:hypothetical protein
MRRWVLPVWSEPLQGRSGAALQSTWAHPGAQPGDLMGRCAVRIAGDQSQQRPDGGLDNYSCGNCAVLTPCDAWRVTHALCQWRYRQLAEAPPPQRLNETCISLHARELLSKSP